MTNSGQAYRPRRGSCSPIPGRGCFGDHPRDEIVVSSPSPIVEPLGAVRRGWGGKGKEWTHCVQNDIRAFDITGDWKATALKAEVWVDTVTEDGRKFMTSRRGKKR